MKFQNLSLDFQVRTQFISDFVEKKRNQPLTIRSYLSKKCELFSSILQLSNGKRLLKKEILKKQREFCHLWSRYLPRILLNLCDFF